MWKKNNFTLQFAAKYFLFKKRIIITELSCKTVAFCVVWKKHFWLWGLKQSLLKIKMSVPKDFFLTFSYIMFATASVAWWHRRVYVCGNGYCARLQCGVRMICPNGSMYARTPLIQVSVKQQYQSPTLCVGHTTKHTPSSH
jgi:hypothetical protein